MNLEEIRNQINSVDDELSALFIKRMELAGEVARFKAENNLPILNRSRERDIISRLSAMYPEDMSLYIKVLYNTLFDLSRSYQGRLTGKAGETAKQLKTVTESTGQVFPSSAIVACQGTEGAYSQQICDKLFANPTIMYMNSFRGVFDAVEQGLCRYGILPVENSIHGSVGEVYDLMDSHKFCIVRSSRLQINHCLLTKPGTSVSDIKEIFSHEQAIGQCEKFLSEHKEIKVTICENTAVAAKMVSESERHDVAAISSGICAELYGLSVIAEDIQDFSNNYTKFICISKKPEIYPGADKISVIVRLPHRPGALYDLMSKFAALGINLTKIESRPIRNRDFEFMFYLEMEVSVYSAELIQLLSELEAEMDFSYLGSYSEV